jgi:two-component sensor histidine kinase
MVRVALGLGWASAAVVILGASGAEIRGVDRSVLWGLVAAAVAVNGALGALPWPRWVGTRWTQRLLAAWAAAVAVLVAVFTHLGAREANTYYLLYFLLVPFIATTQEISAQIALDSLAVGGYLVVALAFPGRGGVPSPRGIVIRGLVLVAACVVNAILAKTLEDVVREQARARGQAELEHLLVDEAHHRIKNLLQLVSDLLGLEATSPGASLDGVVDETRARIQALAAVHQSLARRHDGSVALGPVVRQITNLLTEQADIAVDDVELDGQRATWVALVTHELVTNAVRHGRPPVRVCLALEESALPRGHDVTLSVSDSGPGPTGTPPGLGLTLVERLVHDGLGGTVAWTDGSGIEARFPADAPTTTTRHPPGDDPRRAGRRRTRPTEDPATEGPSLVQPALATTGRTESLASDLGIHPTVGQSARPSGGLAETQAEETGRPTTAPTRQGTTTSLSERPSLPIGRFAAAEGAAAPPAAE